MTPGIFASRNSALNTGGKKSKSFPTPRVADSPKPLGGFLPTGQCQSDQHFCFPSRKRMP